MSRTLAIFVLLFYFLTLLFIVHKKTKNNTVSEYFFGDRKLPFWALTVTYFSAMWSASSVLSTSVLAYKDGLSSFWYYGGPVLLSALVLIFFSKKIRHLGNYTQSEILEKRYSSKISLLLSITIIIFDCLKATALIIAAGHFMGSFLGVDYIIACIIATIIVLFYSYYGGFKGVVLTDILLFFLLFGSYIALLIFSWDKIGGFESFTAGFENINQVAIEKGKINYLSPFDRFEKYIVYIIIFGLAWSIKPTLWQRISATKNVKDAAKMTKYGFLLYIPLYLIVILVGMTSIVLYDSLPEKGLIGTMINDYLPISIATLLFLSISAAIISSLDSIINNGAMVIALDIYPKLSKLKLSDKQKLEFGKYSTIIIGLIGLLLALQIHSILFASWLATQIIATGLFIPLIMGFVWKRGNSKGALASMLYGIFYAIYTILHSVFETLFPLPWDVISLNQLMIGFGGAFILYIGVSLIGNWWDNA